ncbi:hypothetical protein B0H12DRAFT_1240623 [Mycena haematopus]|nr:hypothetical protein B0H12DRAFT_1240623 [Mycena haematopus]
MRRARYGTSCSLRGLQSHEESAVPPAANGLQALLSRQKPVYGTVGPGSSSWCRPVPFFSSKFVRWSRMLSPQLELCGSLWGLDIPLDSPSYVFYCIRVLFLCMLIVRSTGRGHAFQNPHFSRGAQRLGTSPSWNICIDFTIPRSVALDLSKQASPSIACLGTIASSSPSGGWFPCCTPDIEGTPSTRSSMSSGPTVTSVSAIVLAAIEEEGDTHQRESSSDRHRDLSRVARHEENGQDYVDFELEDLGGYARASCTFSEPRLLSFAGYDEEPPPVDPTLVWKLPAVKSAGVRPRVIRREGKLYRISSANSQQFIFYPGLGSVDLQWPNTVSMGSSVPTIPHQCPGISNPDVLGWASSRGSKMEAVEDALQGRNALDRLRTHRRV